MEALRGTFDSLRGTFDELPATPSSHALDGHYKPTVVPKIQRTTGKLEFTNRVRVIYRIPHTAAILTEPPIGGQKKNLGPGTVLDGPIK